MFDFNNNLLFPGLTPSNVSTLDKNIINSIEVIHQTASHIETKLSIKTPRQIS